MPTRRTSGGPRASLPSLARRALPRRTSPCPLCYLERFDCPDTLMVTGLGTTFSRDTLMSMTLGTTFICLLLWAAALTGPAAPNLYITRALWCLVSRSLSALVYDNAFAMAVSAGRSGRTNRITKLPISRSENSRKRSMFWKYLTLTSARSLFATRGDCIGTSGTRRWRRYALTSA